MSKVYSDSGIIGYYRNGSVYRNNPDGNFGDTRDVATYDHSLISVGSKVVARCDEDGYIINEQTSASIAKCDNGMIYVPAAVGWTYSNAAYDGDMYGAAAVVAALMFNLGSEESKDSSLKTDKSEQSVQPVQSAVTPQSGETDILTIIIIIGKILLGLVHLVWILFPIIPVVVLIVAGAWPFALIDAGFVIAGWLLYRSNKKKPSVFKVFFAEGLQTGVWLLVPMIFMYGLLPLVIGFLLVAFRVGVAVVKYLMFDRSPKTK